MASNLFLASPGVSMGSAVGVRQLDSSHFPAADRRQAKAENPIDPNAQSNYRYDTLRHCIVPSSLLFFFLAHVQSYLARPDVNLLADRLVFSFFRVGLLLFFLSLVADSERFSVSINRQYVSVLG